MHRGWSYWLWVCVLGGAALIGAATERGIAAGKKDDKKLDTLKGEKPGAFLEILLDVADALTEKDGRDPQAKDCYTKIFPIELQAGKAYQIDMVSKEFDTFLRLEDATGKQVAEDDDSGGMLNARIVYEAANSGKFKIYATTYQANATGKFKLTVALTAGGKDVAKEKEKEKEKEPKTQPAEALKFKGDGTTTIQGTLAKTDPKDADGKHFKAYSFQGQPGKIYRFELTGELEPFVRLEDGNGKRLKDEDAGDEKKSELAFAPVMAGTYRIIATTFKGGGTGKFTLLARVTEAGTGPGPVAGKGEPLNLVAGKPLTIKGEITAKDPKDGNGKYHKIYSFQGQPGKTYSFVMNGEAKFNPEVRINDATGKLIKNEDDGNDKMSRVNFVPTQPGTYQLVASAFTAGQTGAFTLTASIDGAGTAPPAAAKVVAMPAFQQLFRTEIVGQLTKDDGRDKDGRAFRVYTFQAKPGKLYIVEMNGRQFDAQVRLEDAAGKAFKNEDSFDGHYSMVVLPAGSGGTFRIVASSVVANQFGSFGLSIAERDLRPPVLASVQFDRVSTISGKLAIDDGIDNQGRYYKVFTLPASAGKTYLCEMKANGFAPKLRLEDEKGQILKHEHEGDPFSSRLKWTADTTGTVHLIATTFKPGTHGDFTLTITERGKETTAKPPSPVAGAGALTLVNNQAVVKGELTKSDPTLDGKKYKEFTFQGEANKTYKIDLRSTDFDTYLLLKDSAGKTLAENDNVEPAVILDSRIVYTVEKTGTYRIIATTFDEKKLGAFTLSVVVIAPPKVEKLTLSSKTSGKLTKQDALDGKGNFHKVYAFLGEQGKSYRFELVGKDSFDPTLRVEDDKGKLLREEDYTDGKVSRIIFTAPATAPYRLVVAAFRADSTGEYTLTASEIEVKAALTPLKLENGKANVNGTLTKADAKDAEDKFFKQYELQAVKGKWYQIEMTTNGKLDPLLRVDDMKGNVVQKEDFGGDGKVSRIFFEPPQPGTFRIVASSFNPKEIGDFTLTVTQFDPKDKGKAKEKEPPQPKEKAKEIKLPEMKEGTFPGLKATALPFAGGKDTLAGALTDKDKKDAAGKYYQAFPFKAEAGKLYRFEMTSKGFDPYVRVEDAKGAVLEPEGYGDGKVSRSYFRAYQDGPCRVVATTFKDGMTGDFTLSAAVLDFKGATPAPVPLGKGTVKIDGALKTDDPVLLPVQASMRHYKEYSLQAEAGKAYRIDLHSKAFDAYLILRDGAGKIVAENDDAQPGVTWDARIAFKADKTGPYYIIATSLAGGTGPFVLTAGEADNTDKLMSRIKELPTASAADAKLTLQMLKQQAKELGGKLTAADADLAADVALRLEDLGNKVLATEFYTAIGKAMSGSADPAIAKQARTMLGAGKRLTLVGQPMQVKGTTLDGKAFDLAQLKGKVVLVDFWASWCGPCVKELPQVKKLYEQYHDQGFDVIGISLDISEQTLTSFLAKNKLPWPSIYKEGSDLADDYGVFSIPLTVLVGRDGQVISTSARGAELERLLEKQFGEKKK